MAHSTRFCSRRQQDASVWMPKEVAARRVASRRFSATKREIQVCRPLVGHPAGSGLQTATLHERDAFGFLEGLSAIVSLHHLLLKASRPLDCLIRRATPSGVGAAKEPSKLGAYELSSHWASNTQHPTWHRLRWPQESSLRRLGVTNGAGRGVSCSLSTHMQSKRAPP